MYRLIIFCFAALFALPAFARVSVVVTLTPQKYIVKGIAGDRADVSVMVPIGSSPHIYEPKPKQMTDLSRADVYLSIGDPSEHAWLDKFADMNKKMLIVHTDKGIKKLDMAAHHHDEDGDHDDHDEHGEHEDHDHGHGMKDPHIWLDPVLLSVQADTAAKALIKADPANASFYGANLKKFQADMKALDKKISGLAKKTGNKKFMVFHPSWGYFAARYGYEQIPVEVDGKAPKAQELVELIKEAKEHNLKIIFVQPQFSKKEAETIARETKARVFPINPLAENVGDTLIKAAKAIYDNQ